MCVCVLGTRARACIYIHVCLCVCVSHPNYKNSIYSNLESIRSTAYSYLIYRQLFMKNILLN